MTPASGFNTRRRLAVLFFVPLAFSLLFFLVTVMSEHTDDGLLRIENLAASLSALRAVSTDIESGERGYLLTAEDQFLVPYQSARGSFESKLRDCVDNAIDQPRDLQQSIRNLALNLRKRVAEADAILALARGENHEAALARMRSGEGDRQMNLIRQDVRDLQKRLSDEEAGFLVSQERLNRASFLVFLIGTLVMIAVLSRLYRATVSYLRDRDLAETRLRELNLSLEAQVESRTRDLRLANEELQQFAYVASHDLQEPLRTITSFSQLIEARYKGKLDEDADEFIGYVVTAARRMTDLINGLLTLVRLRRSGQTVDPVSFDEILSDAKSSLQASIRETNAQITSDPLPNLVVDRVQFSQVLQNLISNAIKYRGPRSPKIHVSATRAEGQWTFQVRDNGRGFDSQFAERIFGLFQRLHNRESIEGTGMGLTITRRILERHGGRIWAESVLDQGSTFFFSLPVSLEGTKHLEESSA